jgi:hypothetical protein
MTRVGFEPTTPVFRRAKTVHVSDRAATVITINNIGPSKIFLRIGARVCGNNIRFLPSFICSRLMFTYQQDNCRHRLHARRSRWCKQSTGLPVAPYIPQGTACGSCSRSSANFGKRRHPSSWSSRNWQDSWSIAISLCCWPRSVPRCEGSISSPQCPRNRAPGSYRNGQIRGGQRSNSSGRSPAERHGAVVLTVLRKSA